MRKEYPAVPLSPVPAASPSPVQCFGRKLVTLMRIRSTERKVLEDTRHKLRAGSLNLVATGCTAPHSETQDMSSSHTEPGTDSTIDSTREGPYSE